MLRKRAELKGDYVHKFVHDNGLIYVTKLNIFMNYKNGNISRAELLLKSIRDREVKTAS